MIKHLILLTTITFLFSLIFCSCKKDKGSQQYIPVQTCNDLTRNIDSAKLFIQGKWNWLQEKRADRALGFKYLTPQTEGYTYFNRYSNDTVFGYKNGNLIDTSKFSFGIESEITNYPLDTLPVIIDYNIHTGNRLGYVPFKICKDYLILQQQFRSSISGEFTFHKIN